MGKKGVFNFVWIFAIIAGGAILFLAVYGAFRFGDMKKVQSDTEIAKSLATLTDPMQASFAEGSFGRISLRQETQIRNFCYDDGFGRNEIILATREGIGKDWGATSVPISITNKYIFSSETNDGKDFYVFSKPFEFPYKVSDMTFLISDNYCFLNPPEELSNEIEWLSKIPYIKIKDCSDEDIVVCFGHARDCDVVVYGACRTGCKSIYDEGSVETKRGIVKYSGNLMFAAIFSDEEIYKCNVNRLLERTRKISELLIEKSDLMNARNCNTNLQSDLLIWKGLLENATEENVISLYSISKNLDKLNIGHCNLW